MITICNNQLRLVLDPNKGVSTKAFDLFRNGCWIPVMPDTRLANCNLPYSNFLMIPYSNRIENGTFSFENHIYNLAHSELHSIHGDVRNRRWEIDRKTAESIVCTLNSSHYSTMNWPWDFFAQASFTLDDFALHMTLSITNNGSTSMPAGLGWHPYFNRKITSNGEPVLLHFPLDGAYPDADSTRIPSGPLAPLNPGQNFNTERELLHNNHLDLCYHGFNEGSISWPKSKLRLNISANNTCQHLIIYNPPESGYFAIEPVSNANNGVNLFSQGDHTSGIKVLSPQETLTAICTLKLEEYE